MFTNNKHLLSVVGNTGTGKSFLLNALLRNENILPSSGVSACTSTIVEVAKSSSDNYEAEIEFISEEVRQGLSLMFLNQRSLLINSSFSIFF